MPLHCLNKKVRTEAAIWVLFVQCRFTIVEVSSSTAKLETFVSAMISGKDWLHDIVINSHKTVLLKYSVVIQNIHDMLLLSLQHHFLFVFLAMGIPAQFKVCR